MGLKRRVVKWDEPLPNETWWKYIKRLVWQDVKSYFLFWRGWRR